MSYHLYADAIKIYLPSRSGGSSSHSSLLLCLEEVKCWLEQNRLQLNASKSEVIIFGPNKVDSDIKDVLDTWTTNVQSQIRNLGVIFDSALTFDHQIKCLVKSCFFQLRTIAKIKSFLSGPDLDIVIHPFISSRLD